LGRKRKTRSAGLNGSTWALSRHSAKGVREFASDGKADVWRPVHRGT
jgi:hypothetical protein